MPPNQRAFLHKYFASRATVMLQDAYQALEDAGYASAPGARDIVSDGQERFKRNARNFFTAQKAAQRASTDGRGTWTNKNYFLSNRDESETPGSPYQSILVIAGEPCEVMLAEMSALQTFKSMDEQADHIMFDPPYGIGADEQGYANHAHNEDSFFTGYVEAPDDYLNFMGETLGGATEVLRLGGQISVVTGPNQAMYVGMAAKQLGLTAVDILIQPRPFPPRTTARHSPDYWVITNLCNGPLYGSGRTFNVLPELPTAASGEVYPRSVWPPRPPEFRSGVRYPNSLPWWLYSLLIRAYSNRGDYTVQPFMGSGIGVLMAMRLGRRVLGSDINPNAVKFAQSRVLDNLNLQGPPDLEALNFRGPVSPAHRIDRSTPVSALSLE